MAWLLRHLLMFAIVPWLSIFLPLSSAAVLPQPRIGQSMAQFRNGTTWGNPNCAPSARPKVSLPNDNRPKSYISSSGLDCLDDSSSHVSDCWDILEINDWLPQWFLQIPQCTPQSSSNAGCNDRDPPEPWTTTFMRITTGGGNWNGCSDMGNTNCQYHPYPCLGISDDPLLRARYKYVAYTITNLHQFFSTWSNLMDGVMNQAADSVSGMISVVDPIKEQKTGLRLFLSVLTFGLSFLNSFNLGLSTLQTALFSAVIDAIAKSPMVRDQLWPKETAESQDVQIDQLTDELQGPNGIHSRILDNLAKTQEVVQGANQTDVSAFLAFTSGGFFSADNNPSPFQDLGSRVHRGLLQVFTTYLISEALRLNGWHALIVPGANPVTMDNGTGQCPKWAEGTGKYQCDWWDGSTKWFACGDAYDANNMCENSWWFSQTHNSAYALVKDDNRPNKEGGDFLRTILNKGWSTGPLLFENAAICEFAFLISQSATGVTYTPNYNNMAGFFYQGPPFTGHVAVNETTNFVSIAGGDGGNAFVAATMNADSVGSVRHPDLIFGTQGQSWDSRCVSQLNTTIANSWAPKTAEWTKNDLKS
ncbi:MAG: hypothetical protein Q9204_006377 [Flavoplaca sp. TL-2023a]